MLEPPGTYGHGRLVRRNVGHEPSVSRHVVGWERDLDDAHHLQDGRRGARCIARGSIHSIPYIAAAECRGASLVFAAAVVETRDYASSGAAHRPPHADSAGPAGWLPLPLAVEGHTDAR